MWWDRNLISCTERCGRRVGKGPPWKRPLHGGITCSERAFAFRGDRSGSKIPQHREHRRRLSSIMIHDFFQRPLVPVASTWPPAGHHVLGRSYVCLLELSRLPAVRSTWSPFGDQANQSVRP